MKNRDEMRYQMRYLWTYDIICFKGSEMLSKLKEEMFVAFRSSRFPCFTLHLAAPEPPGTGLSAEDALELRGLRSSHKTVTTKHL